MVLLVQALTADRGGWGWGVRAAQAGYKWLRGRVWGEGGGPRCGRLVQGEALVVQFVT